MIIVVCPGQGSQRPGFLEPWIAEPHFRDHLETLSKAAGIDLIAHGTVSDADTIRDTAVAQPLIVAAGLLSFAALIEVVDEERIGGVAGHSVGEITAAAIAGVLSESDAMAFVRERGEKMAHAATLTATGMSAIIGGTSSDVEARLDEMGLAIAHRNGAGQIVAAGTREALEQIRNEPPAGTRVIPLEVAGAFHTAYMDSAVPPLAELSASFEAKNPHKALWTNHDGSRIVSGREFVDLLVHQVSSPARWDLDMKAFVESGVSGIIELAPVGTLVGLAKRELTGVPTVAVKTPDDLAAAVELVNNAA